MKEETIQEEESDEKHLEKRRGEIRQLEIMEKFLYERKRESNSIWVKNPSAQVLKLQNEPFPSFSIIYSIFRLLFSPYSHTHLHPLTFIHSKFTISHPSTQSNFQSH